MKAITSLSIFTACQLCFASGDTNIIAVSDWSQPVGTVYGQTLRGRMIIAQGRSSAYDGTLPETECYLELQNVSGAARTMQIDFDPADLRCEVVGTDGKAPPQVGGGGSGGGAGPCLITLPYDGTIRLRMGMYGYGTKAGDGLLLTLSPPSQQWHILPGNTNDYFISGTFTVTSPTNFHGRDFERQRTFWSGTLELPMAKIWDGNSMGPIAKGQPEKEVVNQYRELQRRNRLDDDITSSIVLRALGSIEEGNTNRAQQVVLQTIVTYYRFHQRWGGGNTEVLAKIEAALKKYPVLSAELAKEKEFERLTE